jgi:hypothetical protein
VRPEPGWSAEYFAVHPEPPRPLFPEELQRLHRNGFARLALDLAAGTCPSCELNLRSGTHRAICEKPEPLEAKPEPLQPWVPRAPRGKAA